MLNSLVCVCSTWNYVDLHSGSFLPDIDSFLTAKLNCPHFLVSKTFFTKKGINMFGNARLSTPRTQNIFAVKIRNKK